MNPVIGLDVSKGESQIQGWLWAVGIICSKLKAIFISLHTRHPHFFDGKPFFQ